MPAESSPRALRLGGVTVLPGEARSLSLALPDREGDAAARDAVPAWVVMGGEPGPRVTLLGAPRGFETTAARLAARLGVTLRPASIRGSVVVVPVLRPGGRFAAGGRPGKPASVWRFPGDATGRRSAREAFTVFSELVLGASLVVILSEPEPGRGAVATIRCDLEDTRTRRMALRAGAPAIVHAARRAGTLAAASAPEAVVLELTVAPAELDPEGLTTLDTVGRLLCAAGVWAPDSRAALPSPPPERSPTFRRLDSLRAPAGGLIEGAVRPGEIVARGAPLARIVAPLGDSPVAITAPHAGFVLEAPARGGARRGAKLFLLGRLPRGHRESERRGDHGAAASPPLPLPVLRTSSPPSSTSPALSSSSSAAATAATAATVSAVPSAMSTSTSPSSEPPTAIAPLHVGWVERVSLPNLGVKRLRAKIDTGARTSALHVTRMKVVGATAAPHRRPILEIIIPNGSRRAANRPSVVRVPVREYVQIKDTSGRTTRRPVIETTLRMGRLERRIRVTLTDRGDMLFPMLIGRTALGPGVVVDPSRRRLLSES